jgi:hypothetical protein
MSFPPQVGQPTKHSPLRWPCLPLFPSCPSHPSPSPTFSFPLAPAPPHGQHSSTTWPLCTAAPPLPLPPHTHHATPVPRPPPPPPPTPRSALLLEMYTRDGTPGVCMIAADLYEGIR